MPTNDVQITVGANTENFQVAINNAYNRLNTFGLRNKDLAKEVDAVFKSMRNMADDMAVSVETAFNKLQIKSDLASAIMRENAAKTSASWLSDFGKIANSAETTANDVMRSWRKLGELNATSAASVLSAEFKTLGIQSAESIELAKIKIVNAFKEIEASGTQSAQDVSRAHEAMTAEIERLDKMLLTSAERVAAGRAAAFKESAAAERASYAAQGMSGSSAAAGLIGQPLAGAGFGNDLKAQMEEQASLAQIRSREMAGYAASAMQGEASAARLAGNVHAGSDFTAQLKSQMEGVKESVNNVHEGISGWSLASVAAIAKIQILYSIINTVMSKIGELPGALMASVEDYNSSIVANAATITSMADGVKDVGAEYIKNKAYAAAVQNELVGMSATTIASAEQLHKLNNEFVLQGVYLDVNNEKQKQGFLNVANAVAVIGKTMGNENIQFSEQVRQLMEGVNRPNAQLYRTLLGIDPLLKEHLATWRAQGTVLENIGPMLAGYAAATGDISNLWTTVKTTMASITNMVLRGGFSEGFADIVAKSKELLEYLKQNKEAAQAFIKDGFKDIETVASGIWSITKALKSIAEPAMYLGVVAAVMAITKAIEAMNFALKMNPAGAIAGIVAAAGGFAINKGFASANKGLDIEQIKSDVPDSRAIRQGVPVSFYTDLTKNLGKGELDKIHSSLPWADNKQIAEMIRSAAIELHAVAATARSPEGVSVVISQGLVEQYKKFSTVAAPSPPKPPKSNEKGVKENEGGYDEAYRFYSKAFDEREAEAAISANKKLAEINEQGYADGKISLEDYLSDREFIIEDNLKSEIAAKEKELTEAKALDTRSVIKDSKGKVNTDAMDVRELKVLGEIENAKKALAVAEDKLTEAKMKGVKFDDKTKAGVEAKRLKDALEVATAERNLSLEKLQNQIMMLDVAEKMNEISGPDALAKRLPLEQQIAKEQKDYLNTLKPETSAWFKQNMIYMSETAKAAADMKKEFDRTPLGGFTDALKTYAEAATNMGEHVKSFTTTIFKSMEDALVSFVTTGKINFKTMADAIIADMVRIAVQQSVTGPLASGFGSLFGSAFSSTATSTGSSGVGMGSGIPTSVGSTQLSIAQFATGTDFLPMTGLAKVHKGEAIIPADINAKGFTGSSDSNTTFIIQNNTGTQAKAKDGGTSFDGKQMVKTIILEALDTDYTFRNAVRG